MVQRQTVKITVRLPREMYVFLKFLADMTGTSISDVIRTLIAQAMMGFRMNVMQLSLLDFKLRGIDMEKIERENESEGEGE